MSIFDRILEETNKNKYNSFILDSVNSKNYEQVIKIIFNHELKAEFHNILLLTKNNFIDTVKQKVLSVLNVKYSNNISENNIVTSTLTKYIQKLNNKYDKNYVNISKQFNSFQSEKEKYKYNNNICLSKFYFSSHRKHCSNTSNYATHFCYKKRGIINIGKFIKIKNDFKNEKVDYLVCENCQKTYFAESFICYCQYCKEEYFCSPLNNDEKKYLLPATLRNNHCEIVINEILNCPQCKKVLYLNLNINKLQCINDKCKNHNFSKNTEWKCKTCSKYFHSDAIVYNPLEIKILSEEINYSLSVKIKAKPQKLPCCKYIDLNNIDFYHSQKCEGLIYFGEFNKKIFIICEKCKAINFLDKFIWTCPKCNCRFREIKENEKNNNFIINNNGLGKIYQIKELSEKIKNLEIKTISNLVEKRKKSIYTQEYDYDDSNCKNIFNNDENIDMNIIKNDYLTNKNKYNLNLTNDNNLKKHNIYVYQRSRNDIKANNSIYSKLLNKKKLSIISDNVSKDKINMISSFNLTSNDFYSEKPNKIFVSNDKNKKKKKIIIKLINTDSINNNYLSINKNNDTIEKRNRKFYIPHSKYNKSSKIESTKNVKNINFCDIKSLIEKKKNYTPYLKRQSLKSEKSNHIETNISNFNINNEEKGNIKIRNRSPFVLRRILNFSIGKIDSKNDIKKEFKYEEKNKYKNKNEYEKKEENKQNLFYLRLKSSDNVDKNNRNRNKKINLNNSNNSFLIRKSIFSSEYNRNKNREIIKNKEKERVNLLSQRETKIKRYIVFNNNNIKSKSENKINENQEDNKEKNKYKKKIKQNREEKSLKPKDIVEPSKIDLSRDITIVNESIQKDKKLYQDIQFKVKKILSKGRLPQFFFRKLHSNKAIR